MSRHELIFAAFYSTLGAGLGAVALYLTWRALRTGLLKNELLHFFASPMAWLVMAGVTFVNGYFFNFIVEHYTGAPNQPLPTLQFGNLFFWILQFLLVPAITMRAIAEERATGTLEALMTAPVTDAEVVFAKYLGALIFYAALWVPTMVHLATAYYYGVPDDFWARVTEAAAKPDGPSRLVGFFRELNATMDFGPIFGAYLGIVLVGSAWLSMGLIASALAQNQIVAFVGAFVMTLMTFTISFAGSLVPDEPAWRWLADGLRYVSFQQAYEPFPRGLVDSRSVVFLLSVTALSLFLTVRVVESRKWR